MLAPSSLNCYAHIYATGKPHPPTPHKTISVDHKYDFSKLLLRKLEQEIGGFCIMGIIGKQIITFWTKIVSWDQIASLTSSWQPHNKAQQADYSYRQNHQQSSKEGGCVLWCLVLLLFLSLSLPSLFLSFPLPHHTLLLSFPTALSIPLGLWFPQQYLLEICILSLTEPACLLHFRFLTTRCS